MDCAPDYRLDSDLAIFVLHLASASSQSNTPKYQRALERLLRWSVINEGLADCHRLLRSQTQVRTIAHYTQFLDTDVFSLRLCSDYHSGLCLITAWHADWDGERLYCVERVVGNLIQMGLGRGLVSPVAPNSLGVRSTSYRMLSRAPVPIGDALGEMHPTPPVASFTAIRSITAFDF